MSPYQKRCGIILFHPKTEKYLLVRGKYSKKWGFPKGHMEDGEDEEQTAIREFYEETGLSVSVPFDHRLRFGNNVYFVKTKCENRHPVIQDTKEIEDIRWFTKNDILLFSKDQCNFGLSMWRRYILHTLGNLSRVTRFKKYGSAQLSSPISSACVQQMSWRYKARIFQSKTQKSASDEHIHSYPLCEPHDEKEPIDKNWFHRITIASR